MWTEAAIETLRQMALEYKLVFRKILSLLVIRRF
jgi:hypothetical protein